MTFKEYQQYAMLTAIFPEDVRETYPALGLADELSEYLLAIKQDKPYEDLLSELGDVLWYLAATCQELNIPSERFFKEKVDFEELTENTDHVWESNTFSRLLSAVSDVLGTVKKYLRGDFDYAMYRRRMESHVGFIAECIAYESFDSVSLAMKLNIGKLLMRQAEDKLQGDGDHR